MQIREIVLYGLNGKVRHLSFKLGTVNIISGKSKSGKSAVGDIIDYCLGGDSCNIADGVIRENIAWYGLLLQFKNERVFVARKNPAPGQQSTGYCYIEIGKEIEVPKKCNFVSNENVSGLEEMLSRRVGIVENLHTPLDGQSRKPLSANIRHALYYCFQNQDEIAAKNFIFHKQSDDFITQAIKDTLPYFMGVVNEDALALENEKSILKRRLIIKKRRLEENRALQGGGMERAIALISEAKQVGIIDYNNTVDYNSYDSLYNLLLTTEEWTPNNVSEIGMDRLSYLQNILEERKHDLEELGLSLSNAKAFAGETTGYVNEVSHQKMRLESIGLFEKLDFKLGFCPLCSGKLVNSLPGVEMIKTAICNLDQNIKNVTREKPKLRKFIDDLEQERQNLREEITNLKAEIDGIYIQNEEAKKLKDLNARRAKVVGRISLWLESVEKDTDFENKEIEIKKLEERIAEIDKLLDKDTLEERRQSALSRISVDMSKWAKDLNLEHSDNPYRLDMNKVTVVVDKPERPVPLKQLGSGSNWVGVHLITYFALHRYFINANRPVPSFMFFDQPSQVYFPSELDDKKTDWNMVYGLYDFIIERVNDLKGDLQVIIVDHADLKDKKFRKLITEDWWHENNLIPEDWYK
ncbi:DUF3732 domain-containing protein [Clostridium botulinum]|uniref:DUF3732 domain-containing protein n=1 Tax=Clostridium botulinum TaxID=1491 RepID=UPI0006A735EB|nr:DUF3732 domain-containing protein [Clostridium botulinum]KON10977.1 hypothetical protein ACP52_02425 [Clostridium botulinum]MBY6904186.1 DUF3732 domain-containing protein [Clostridium botulinum]MBY6925640.1 DUF3732 domain-containing protein [Clostridium botulinum]MBY6953563.1 DUF3732 domain-containing protein [Clostridium botulinum]MCR1177995.1 DUF3732 domain-containing protein [Clostridium botulinum]